MFRWNTRKRFFYREHNIDSFFAIDFFSDVNSGFFYKSSSEREKLVSAERAFIEERVKKIIELKKKIIDDAPDGKGKILVVINQKGIDPPSLNMLAKAGIVAIRRAKRRNMERITLACGGEAMNSVDELTADDLGFAKVVYEHVLRKEKYTFIENVKNPRSVTLLIRGPNKHTLTQIEDAIHDGLRAAKNAIDDVRLYQEQGAFEIACHETLMADRGEEIEGRPRLGVQAYAEALLVIPKTLARNAGLDAQDSIVKLQEVYMATKQPAGLDLSTDEAIIPADAGIPDNI